MKKIILKLILSLIALTIAIPAAFSEETYWISPILRNDKTSRGQTSDVIEYREDSVTYHFPAGVYVQVFSEKNGRIILGNDTLAERTYSITYHTTSDWAKRREISKTEYDRAQNLKNYLTVINDSILEFDLRYAEGHGDLDIYVNGRLLHSIHPAYGEFRRIPLRELGLSSAVGSMFLAQDERLSTYVKLEDLPKSIETITKNEPIWEENEYKEPEESDDNLLLGIIVFSVILGLIIFLCIVIIKYIRKRFSGGKGKSTGKPNKPDYFEENLKLGYEVRQLNRKLSREQTAKDKAIRDLDLERREKEKALEDTKKKEKELQDRILELEKELDWEKLQAKEEKEWYIDELERAKAESAELEDVKDELADAKRQLEEVPTKADTSGGHFTEVPEAVAYCDYVVRLIALAKDVQKAAGALLTAEIQGKYYLFKALALYSAKLNTIDLASLYADVEMISKTGFVINGTPLAANNVSLTKEEAERLTRKYFFTTYLKTYVDALVVLNESMAGMSYPGGDAIAPDLKPFDVFRMQIETIVKKLGITYQTVRIYDTVGGNPDVAATEMDAGVKKHGAVVEIDSCRVSLIGEPTADPIVVKVQR